MHGANMKITKCTFLGFQREECSGYNRVAFDTIGRTGVSEGAIALIFRVEIVEFRLMLKF
jgi:hypothetical protein